MEGTGQPTNKKFLPRQHFNTLHSASLRKDAGGRSGGDRKWEVVLEKGRASIQAGTPLIGTKPHFAYSQYVTSLISATESALKETNMKIAAMRCEN